MADTKDVPNVIAPPPLIYAAGLAAGVVVDFLLLRVASGIAPGLRWGAAIVLLGAGLGLLGGALAGFRGVGTRPEPWRPTTAIVSRGVYSLSRNPMYLGMALVYGAAALALDSMVALAVLIPVLLAIRYGVIAREERYLEARFGDEYARYRSAVRRWI